VISPSTAPQTAATSDEVGGRAVTRL